MRRTASRRLYSAVPSVSRKNDSGGRSQKNMSVGWALLYRRILSVTAMDSERD